MSSEYEDFIKYARDKNGTLTRDMFLHTASVVHHDGSTLMLTNALVEEHGSHYVIFTEHLGYFVFDSDDVTVMWIVSGQAENRKLGYWKGKVEMSECFDDTDDDIIAEFGV